MPTPRCETLSQRVRIEAGLPTAPRHALPEDLLRVNRAANKAAKIRVAPALQRAQPALWAAVKAIVQVAFSLVGSLSGGRGSASGSPWPRGRGCLSHQGGGQARLPRVATSGGRQQVDFRERRSAPGCRQRLGREPLAARAVPYTEHDGAAFSEGRQTDPLAVDAAAVVFS